MTDEPGATFRFLHLEDNRIDAELIGATLKDAGISCHLQVVNNRDEFVKAIEHAKFDLILSDFSLPSFNGNEALELVRNKTADTPFIFVSGTLGEDAAIQSLREGATDYVLKQRLGRLVPAVKRALREADEKKNLRFAERMRQIALEDLQASEARFRGLLESAPDAIVITDSQGRITFANFETERVFRYEREELIGKPLSILVPERFRKMHEKQMITFSLQPHRRALNSGMELVGCRNDGSEFPADIMLSPLKMDHEIAVLAMIRDITASKEAEKALRESEERFRSIYELSPIGILSVDANGKFLRYNPAALKLLGYNETELSGMMFNDLTHPDDLTIGLDLLEELKAGRSEIIDFEKRYLRKDGEVVWAHLTVSAVRDGLNNLMSTVSVIEDITKRKDAEEALRRSEERYRNLVDGARDAIFSLSTNAIIQSLNPAFEIMTGWEREEWIGRSFTDLLHGDDREKAFLGFEKVLKGEFTGVRQFRIRKKSGGYLVGEFNTTAQIRRGKITGILGIVRDVTAQKVLEEQLRQSQKLESIGTLAGGIAHDFNNILGIVVGYTGFLKKSVSSEGFFGGDNKLSRSIDAIETAAQRGVGLVRQLLMFARKEDKILQTLDVNDIVNDVLKLISETFPKVISISLKLSDSPMVIVGDQTEIHQAVLNLCVNARDAMMYRDDGKTSGGTLEIMTALVKGHALQAKFAPAEYDEYVKVTVTDTGVGMDDATRARIFEPFFTTKERGKGTGLGLATVYGIIQSHEGFVDVFTKLGGGTTFDVFLPSRYSHAGSRIELSSEDVEIHGGNESILVVEDETGLRELLNEILASSGYRVLTAADGRSAIAFFLDHRNIELVLSDIGLPNVGGIDLLEAIRKINPGVKVILTSGFVEEGERKKMMQAGVKAFLQKPYSPHEVIRTVRSVLDDK